VRAIVTVGMLSRYGMSSFISDKQCISSKVLGYLMVLINAISVIMTEYMI
jgi:hypothetical protein